MHRLIHTNRHRILAKRHPPRAPHNPDLLLSERILLERSRSREQRVSAAFRPSCLSGGVVFYPLELDLFCVLSRVSETSHYGSVEAKTNKEFQWLARHRTLFNERPAPVVGSGLLLQHYQGDVRGRYEL